MNKARIRSLTLAAAAVTAGAVLTACGSSSGGGGSTTGSSGGSSTGSSSGAAATITISGFAYGSPVTVAPGATVTVDNNDSVEHTVTSTTAGTFDTGSVTGGQSATFKAPSQDGSYSFGCTFHPSMHGKLTVAG